MPSITIDFRTPVVPKKNSKTARIAGNGRAYMHRTRRAVVSEDALAYEARQAAHDAHWAITDADCRVRLIFAWNGRADAIGLAETVLDAMQEIIYTNDRQARTLMLDMLPKGSDFEKQGFSCRAEVEMK